MTMRCPKPPTPGRKNQLSGSNACVRSWVNFGCFFLLLFVFVPRLNTPVSLSVPEMAGIIYMPRGVGGEGWGNLFEDVPLVEFMYVVFTCMSGELP